MKINPEKWAEKLFEVQGNIDAYGVIDRYSKPMVGIHGDVINPHFKFYNRALKWAKKNRPRGNA
jgi:CRISPR/Cas system CMR subunit Cmr6 (Cas7 group RAMP superfamily)